MHTLTHARGQCFGTFEGVSISQFVAAARRENVAVETFTPPGGESLKELRDRAEDFFLSLCTYVTCMYMDVYLKHSCQSGANKSVLCPAVSVLS